MQIAVKFCYILQIRAFAILLQALPIRASVAICQLT